MRDIDWHGVGLLLIGAWQAFKEFRTQREKKKVAEDLVTAAKNLGPLAEKMQRDMAPIFEKAAKIGQQFQRKETVPPPVSRGL
jgi:hypothetical protein